MKTQHFLKSLEREVIQKAIESAEQGNSADIVVYIVHQKINDPVAAAKEHFCNLRLNQAKAQNSFLIFIAPLSQNFAVVGGSALHEKVGAAWWEDLSLIMAGYFKEARYSDGLVTALDKAGQALRLYFPEQSPDRAGQRNIVEE